MLCLSAPLCQVLEFAADALREDKAFRRALEAVGAKSASRRSRTQGRRNSTILLVSGRGVGCRIGMCFVAW